MLFLIPILALAVFFDLRERRIPNSLILVGLVAGLVVSIMASGMQGLLAALGGIAIGAGAFVPFFALRWLGAGDVKLMGVVGGFVGLGSIGPVLLYTLLAGGIVGAIAVLASGRTMPFFSNLWRGIRSLTVLKMTGELPINESTGGQGSGGSVLRIPYAVAIAAGTIAWMLQKSP